MFLILLLAVIIAGTEGRLAGECANFCNDMAHDILTLDICAKAKKELPVPKIGNFCTAAMEAGYRDACMALCMEEKPEYRIAAACREAAIELPRPAVRRWCEHGYSTAFSSTQRALESLNIMDLTDPKQEDDLYHGSGVKGDPANEEVTIGFAYKGSNYTLKLSKALGAEEAIVSFCKEHPVDSLVDCIRDILPNVIERLGADSNQEF
jgi:hypothetical protein